MPRKKQSTDQKIQDLKNKNLSKSNDTQEEKNDSSASTKVSDNSSVSGDGQNQTQTQNQNQTQDDAIQKLSAEQDALKKEIEELKAKNLRLLADMQNVMKQNEMDIDRAKKSVKKEIALSLVDFVSNMNLAFSYTPQTSETVVKDFVNRLKTSLDTSLKTLQKFNIEIIIPNPGDSFNPEFMNAINEPPDSSSTPTVKGVVSAGVKVDGQVIKPAIVTF